MESTETISAPMRKATSIAVLLLPTAVGPTNAPTLVTRRLRSWRPDTPRRKATREPGSLPDYLRRDDREVQEGRVRNFRPLPRGAARSAQATPRCSRSLRPFP